MRTSERFESSKNPVLLAVGLLTLLAGGAVMSAWALKLDFLAESSPVIFAMQFNTALCFALCGGAFISGVFQQTAGVHFLVAGVIFFAGLNLIQYFMGMSVGIDELLIKPFISVGASAPGRMSPNTASCFLLVSAGLMLPRRKGNNHARMVLGLLVIGIATFTVIGYAIQLETTLDWIGVARMSPHTAMGFIALGFGLIYAGSDNGHLYIILPVACLLLIVFAFLILDTDTSADLSSTVVTYLLLDKEAVEKPDRLSLLVAAAVFLYLGLALYALWHARRYSENMKKLEKSEAQLSAIIGQAADGVILIDKQGRILSANAASEAMFGFRRHEMVGLNVNSLMPKDQATRHDSYFGHSLDASQTRTISDDRALQAKHRDGTIFPIELSVSRIDVDGMTIYSGIVRDISDRKEAETALLAANAELEDFAYRTSHDLRSPVASAIGLVRICEAQMQEKDYKSLAENLTRLHKSFLRLDKLIENIIEVTRSRLMVEQPAILSIRAIIDDTLKELIHLEGYEDMTFQIDIDPSLELETSPVKFQMIIRNLLSNAIKYRDKQEANSELRMSAHQSDTIVRLTFCDNGIGIAPEDQPKLFEMFRRFHPNVAVGSGLGLYIMKKCAEALGGKIWFEAQPNGSCFILEIPNGGPHAPKDHPDR